MENRAEFADLRTKVDVAGNRSSIRSIFQGSRL
jgi:hypothetical protein